MKKVFFLLLVVFTTIANSGCDECRNGLRIQVVTIPRDNWFPQIESMFHNSSIRLNTYTPNKNEFDGSSAFQYFKPNDIRVNIFGMSANMGQSIDRNNFRYEPYTVYLTDINSDSVSASLRPNDLVLNMRFESEGTEVFVNCVENIICASDPTAEIDNASITIALSPIVNQAGQLSFQGRSSFNANTRISLCTDNVFAFICDLIGVNGGTINHEIENGINNFINSAEFQNIVANQFTNIIASEFHDGERLMGVIITTTGDLMLLKGVPCQ